TPPRPADSPLRPHSAPVYTTRPGTNPSPLSAPVGTMTRMSWTLPRDFRFGASSAATQIEGAASADGKGPSIWDTFAATPGRIHDGSTPAVTCDHYHRHRDDVALM